MKQGTVNGRPDWTFWFPDQIADWDAITGWEEERLVSMETSLNRGMVLYDVGVEHGWLSAVYGTFVGHNNMVLVEPSPEMWVNIRKTWWANGFVDPIASFQSFCGATFDTDDLEMAAWPACSRRYAFDQETLAMPYRYLGDVNISTVTVDQIVEVTRRPPDAITVDVEGYELEVMRGAEHTLLWVRPLVWLSVHPDLMVKHVGYTVDDLFDFMSGCGYRWTHLATDHEQHYMFTPDEMP